MAVFEHRCKVAKVDDELGVVFGWAIVCQEDGRDYFDLQGDHITQKAMMGATVRFAEGARVAKEMHVGEGKGTVLFMFPMTDEVAKSFGIDCPTRGLMIGMKPDEDVLEKFKDGTYTGFSIGGRRVRDEEIA